MAERTLIIIKPDGVQRRLAGEIMGRFEKRGFKLVAARFMRVSQELARRLYAVHEGRDFYEPVVGYLSRGPMLVTVWEAKGVIRTSRNTVGATFGYEAEPGAICGDFGCSQRYNLVRGSDSADSAEREIALFFRPEEIVEYELGDAECVFGKS